MLYTSIRRLRLCSWLLSHSPQTLFSSLKLQKFLFLYESFSKAIGETADFSYLKGYEKGPVYSDVYGDYTYRSTDFINKIIQISNEGLSTLEKASDSLIINEKLAEKAAFLVSILTEKELSELTHSFNIWKSAEKRILSGEKHVSLNSFDFSDSDVTFAKDLLDMYSLNQIENWNIINLNETYFLVDKKENALISDDLQKVLHEIASNETENPVYISVKDGVIVIDR